MLKKGLVLTNAISASEHDEKLFNEALDYLMQFDLSVIEFYTDEERARRFGDAVRDRGFEPIFLSGMDQKRNSKCRLCSEEEEQRRYSVDFMKRSIEKAIKSGAKRTLIQGGAYPADPKKEVLAMAALEKSLRELSDFSGKDIILLLEPCDRSVDMCQLIGPSMQAYSLFKKLSLPNVRLTMDVAHVTELFEEVGAALALCKPFCNHVHLANCVLDTTSELFGDKHPFFGAEKSCYSVAQSKDLYEEIKAIYGDDDVTVSMEMIGHDPEYMAYMQKLVDHVSWFFLKKEKA